MKLVCLFIVTGAFFSGCHQSAYQAPIKEMPWVTELHKTIEETEDAYNDKLALERELTDHPFFDPMPTAYYALPFKVSIGLNELWNISRCGLFLDIAPDKLIENTPIILRRYRNYADANKYVDYSQVTLANTRSNIDAIDTWYYQQALHVIQDSILFSNRISSTSYHPFIPDDMEQRVKIIEQRQIAQKAMEVWYKANKDILCWNDSLASFEVDGAERLPTAVVKLASDCYLGE